MIEHLRENSLNPSVEVHGAQVQLAPVLVSGSPFPVI